MDKKIEGSLRLYIANICLIKDRLHYIFRISEFFTHCINKRPIIVRKKFQQSILYKTIGIARHITLDSAHRSDNARISDCSTDSPSRDSDIFTQSIQYDYLFLCCFISNHEWTHKCIKNKVLIHFITEQKYICSCDDVYKRLSFMVTIDSAAGIVGRVSDDDFCFVSYCLLYCLYVDMTICVTLDNYWYRSDKFYLFDIRRSIGSDDDNFFTRINEGEEYFIDACLCSIADDNIVLHNCLSIHSTRIRSYLLSECRESGNGNIFGHICSIQCIMHRCYKCLRWFIVQMSCSKINDSFPLCFERTSLLCKSDSRAILDRISKLREHLIRYNKKQMCIYICLEKNRKSFNHKKANDDTLFLCDLF